MPRGNGYRWNNGSHNCVLFREVESDGKFYVWCAVDAEITHEWEANFPTMWEAAKYETLRIRAKCQTSPRDCTQFRNLVELDPRKVVCVPCNRNLRSNEVYGNHLQTNEHIYSLHLRSKSAPVYEQAGA